MNEFVERFLDEVTVLICFCFDSFPTKTGSLICSLMAKKSRAKPRTSGLDTLVTAGKH